MELELHQLDLRYESLRVVSPRAERRLFASIGERGQLVPISVVPEKHSGDEDLQRYVVLDGFARVRVLRRLGHDTAQAMAWDLSELEALLLVRSLRSSERETALEQAWLLEELARRFDLDQEELARRFDRTQSWVSRRLALIRELPASVHEQIRQGRIVPHAAAKYLVPMARASREDCERLARAIAGEDLSSRDIGELYTGWRDGSPIAREHLIENPALFLRVRRSAETTAGAAEELDLREALLKEVSVIGAAIRRAKAWVRRGAGEELTPSDLENLCGSFRAVGSEISRLIELAHNHKEESDAGSRHKDGDPRAA
jgi:ParB/RepB/Spo0J family partition protein